MERQADAMLDPMLSLIVQISCLLAERPELKAILQNVQVEGTGRLGLDLSFSQLAWLGCRQFLV